MPRTAAAKGNGRREREDCPPTVKSPRHPPRPLPVPGTPCRCASAPRSHYFADRPRHPAALMPPPRRGRVRNQMEPSNTGQNRPASVACSSSSCSRLQWSIIHCHISNHSPELHAATTSDNSSRYNRAPDGGPPDFIVRLLTTLTSVGWGRHTFLLLCYYTTKFQPQQRKKKHFNLNLSICM